MTASQGFVARDAELARLDELLARAADRRPGTAVVRGEAGVGKSRLLREFAAVARSRGAVVLWGSGIPLGEGDLAFAPIIDAVRRLKKEIGEQALREFAGEAYDQIADLMPDFTGARPVPGSRLRVFGAVLRLLDRLGGSGPVLLVLEDLHWADTSTLDLLTYLTSALTDERLVLACSCRTSDLPVRHPVRAWLTELELARRVERIELARFTRAELRRLLTSLIGTVPHHEIVERAFDLSDGNAFFAEELVVAGALEAAPAQLPGSLRDLVLARYALLGPDARAVMRVAATAGRQVSHGLLTAVCEMGGSALLEALRECVAHQMLVVGGEGRTYVFRHALLREAVHQELLPGERESLHLAVARALAADPRLSYAEGLTVAAELSYHWYEAREHTEAFAAAVRAGDAAMAACAFPEAESQYLRALSMWSEVDTEGLTRDGLLASAADSARWSGHLARAVDLMREALTNTEISHRDRRGELYERLGNFLWEAGDGPASAQAYAEAEALLADRPRSAVLARVLAGRATADLRIGRHSAGLRLSRAAADMARAVGARPEEGRALNTEGIALSMLGRAAEGVESLRSALRIADVEGHHEDRYRAYGNLAFALDLAGELEEALSVAMTGLRRARDAGFEHTRAAGVLANNASATLVRLGRWDEASEFISAVLVDRPVRESRYPRLTLAEIEVARGRFAEATELLASLHLGGDRDAELDGHICLCEAEQAVWRRDLGATITAVTAGLAAVGEQENATMALRLYAVGLRAAADHRHQPAGPDLKSTVDRMWAAAGELSVPGAPLVLPDVGPLAALCAAEHARLGGTARALDWAQVAERWAALGRPYQVAYARWREAEAAAEDRRHGRASEAAREAHRVAVALGAVPLRREIDALAVRARLDLAAPEPPVSAAPPAVPFGLTRREVDVLELVCRGRSNREIGRELFISEKTASVHVSNIMAKCGASSRLAAAAMAHELGMFEERPQ